MLIKPTVYLPGLLWKVVSLDRCALFLLFEGLWQFRTCRDRIFLIGLLNIGLMCKGYSTVRHHSIAHDMTRLFTPLFDCSRHDSIAYDMIRLLTISFDYSRHHSIAYDMTRLAFWTYSTLGVDCIVLKELAYHLHSTLLSISLKSISLN